MILPSKLIEEAVNEIAKLPGIGRKSALRIALHLLKREEAQSIQLSEALVNLRTKITYCRQCFNIADTEQCSICTNPRRDKSLICVVEDTRDVLAIENTAQYRGLYHVLGGLVAPLQGISPADLKIEALLKRLQGEESEVKEIILALSPTMDGDTTAFYLQKKLKSFNFKMSTIARGIPIGGNIEYADEITLGRAITSRVSYD